MTVQSPSKTAAPGHLTRVCKRVGRMTGIEFLESLQETKEPVFVFASPRSGRSIYAVGSVREVSHDGPDAFSVIEEECSRTREQTQTLSSGPRDLPLWVGSLACMPGRTAKTSGMWAGWPDARFWIPRVMMVDDGPQGRWLVLAENADERRRAWTEGPMDKRAEPVKRGDYERRVASAIETVSTEWGPRKLVVARAARFPSGSGEPPLHRLLAAASAQEPTATHVIVRWPGAGTFVAATPERLVAVNDRGVTTEALAGTARRGPGEAQALMASRKDRHEHRVVVEDLAAGLRPLCERLDVPDTPEIKTLRSLLHLRTPIHGRLRASSHVLSIAARLHPTPAIVGSPAAAASRWLATNEGFDRGHYAGPVGWFDGQGNGELAIALRSALIRDGQTWAFAGAGIVAASDPAAEWHETEAKLATAFATIVGAAPVDSDHDVALEQLR